MQEVPNPLLCRTGDNDCYLRDAWPCCFDLSLCGGYFPFWSTLTSVTSLNTFMAPTNLDSIRYVVISQMMNVAWVTTETQTDMPSNDGQAYSDHLGYCWKGWGPFSVDLWCGVAQILAMILRQGLLLLYSLRQLQVSGMGKAFGPTIVFNEWWVKGWALSTIQKPFGISPSSPLWDLTHSIFSSSSDFCHYLSNKRETWSIFSRTNALSPPTVWSFLGFRHHTHSKGIDFKS